MGLKLVGDRMLGDGGLPLVIFGFAENTVGICVFA
jgi:hypothetical protein